MNEETKQPEVFVKKTPFLSRQTVLVGILAGIIVLTAATLGFLFATDRLVFNRQGSTDTAVPVARCGTEVIGHYKDAFSQSSREGFTEKLRTVGDEIAKIDGNAADPNCLYIRYMAAIQIEDYTAAGTLVDQLHTLAQDGRYPTAAVGTVRDVESLRQELKIRTDPASTTEQDPSGRGEGRG